MDSQKTPQAYQDLDRYRVKQVIDRFLWINNERLDRCRRSLNLHQQIFLDSLSMLFHANHPLLPGFVSHDCPWGVANFEPDKEQLRVASKFSRGYKYRKQKRRTQDIAGIYLMGSPGSIAHVGSSDLDIWLCHRPDLDADGIRLLQQKAQKIEKWAEELSLEVHFFVMDPGRFRAGFSAELEGEDCGSAQHYMLLDEFYRTAVRVSGCYPLWWLIPPHQENQYEEFAEKLLDLPFLKPSQILDFGPLSQIPAGEFVGAGMWQLSKAIESPYKSVMKLLLTEVYASEYPNTRLLSQDLKIAIYEGQDDADELDPYVMLYRRISHYAKGLGQLPRLDLIRKCFYMKAAQKLTQNPGNRDKSWRHNLMSKLTNEWHWSDQKLARLDQRHHWKIDQVTAERKGLVNELIHSYKFLTGMHRQYKEQCFIRPKEMTLLGHKLYAAFDRKAGKIENANPGISRSVREDHLHLHRKTKTTAWSLYQADPQDQRNKPVKTSQSLIEIMCWASFNGLVDRQTRLHWQDDQEKMPEEELHQLLMTLDKLPSRQQRKQQANFEHKPQLSQLTFFINMGVDPHEHLKQQGIHLLSERNDSLSYSALRENLILSMELLSINSWGEVHVSHYQGAGALGQCIEHLLTSLPPGAQTKMPQLQFHCFSSSKAMLISQRIRQLFKEVISAFYGKAGSVHCRYVLPMEDHFQVISLKDKASCTQVEDIHELYQQLAQDCEHFSPIVLDSHLDLPPLNQLAKINKIAQVQIFQQQQTIWILDEKGALLHFESQAKAEYILNDLYLFMSQLQQRQQLYGQGGDFEILLFKFDQHWQLQLYPAASLVNIASVFDIQASIEEADRDLGFVSLTCNGRLYEEIELDDTLYDDFARDLLSLRPSSEPYPCFITDLDISSGLGVGPANQYQTLDYLKYKIELEQKINTAMVSLTSADSKPAG